MFSRKTILVLSFSIIFCFLFNFTTPTAQALTLKQKQTLISSLQKQITALQERLKTLYVELNKTAALITALPGSSLSLSLADDNPKTHNIARGSTDAVFLKANFSAGVTEDIRINSIRVYVYKNSGQTLVEKNDIKNLKIFEGKNQIGVTQAEISDGLAIFAGLNWQILAGTTKTLTLTADVPIETDNDNLQIIIQGGNNLNVSGVKTGKSILAQGSDEGSFLKIVPSGALSISLSGNSSTTASAKNIIQKGKTYLDFLKINFSATDAEAMVVKSVTIKRDGCSDLDFSKLRIYDVGTRLSADTVFVNEEATFDLSAVADWRVPAGATKTLTVKADLSTLDTAACQVRFCLATTTDNNYQISAQGFASGAKINVNGSMPFCGSYSNLVGLPPAVTLLSPNGGERLIKSKSYDIAWSSVSLGTPGIKINISLWKVNSDNTFSLNQTIVSDVDPLAGKYSWDVPKNLVVGKYKIVLFTVGFAKSDESDSYFYVIK